MAGRDLIAVARETVDGFNAGDRKRYKATLSSDVVMALLQQIGALKQ